MVKEKKKHVSMKAKIKKAKKAELSGKVSKEMKMELAGINNKVKQLYPDRTTTEDTVYIIAMGIAKGETPWYIGKQTGRTTDEVVAIIRRYHDLCIHKVRVTSRERKLTEQQASAMIYRCISCTDKHYYFE